MTPKCSPSGAKRTPNGLQMVPQGPPGVIFSDLFLSGNENVESARNVIRMLYARGRTSVRKAKTEQKSYRNRLQELKHHLHLTVLPLRGVGRMSGRLEKNKNYPTRSQNVPKWTRKDPKWPPNAPSGTSRGNLGALFLPPDRKMHPKCLPNGTREPPKSLPEPS